MSKAAKIGCGVCVFVAIVFGVLMAFSYKKLAANEVGLDYSANSLLINTDRLYTAGIHYLGVGHSWILYTRKILTLEMTSEREKILARTKDGLQISLKCRLDYRLMIDAKRLAALYLMFKGEYEKAYRSITRGAVRDVAAEYTAFEFWRQRENITEAMREVLYTKLQDVHALTDNFVILDYKLPTKFKNAVTDTDVWNQEKQKVQYEMETAETEIQTLIKGADITVDKKLIQARREANTTILDFEAQKQGIESLVAAELKSLSTLKEDLELTSDELLTIVWLRSIGTAMNSKKMYHVSSPSLLEL